MIVNCAHCDARYDVPAASIGEGRNLRCVECGKSWWQGPGEEPGKGDKPAAGDAAADVETPPQDVAERPATGPGDTLTDPPADGTIATTPGAALAVTSPTPVTDGAAPVSPRTTADTLEGSAPTPSGDRPVDILVADESEEPLYAQEVPRDPPVARRGRGIMIALAFCAACVAAVAYLLAIGNPLVRQVVSPVISVVSTDPIDDGRNVEISMRIANPSDLTVKVPTIAVSVDDAAGREQSQRRLPAPVATLRPNAAIETQVAVPRVDPGERMRIGFAPE